MAPSEIAEALGCRFKSAMPRGQSYTLEGQLLYGRVGLLALRMDGGGTWQLDAPRRMQPLVGKRDTVSGIRSAFNMIDVNEFAPA